MKFFVAMVSLPHYIVTKLLTCAAKRSPASPTYWELTKHEQVPTTHKGMHKWNDLTTLCYYYSTISSIAECYIAFMFLGLWF